jgi:hypothetical protein
MKKLTAILGMAAIFGGLTFTEAALAFQTTSTAPAGTTTSSTAAQTKAQKKAAKEAAKSGAASTTSAATAAPAATGKPAAATTPNATTTSSPAKAQATTTSKSTAKPVTPTQTPQQIADAKAKGLVWVNTSSKVYHTSSDRYYGATKEGQFMTVADAQKMGAHQAK